MIAGVSWVWWVGFHAAVALLLVGDWLLPGHRRETRHAQAFAWLGTAILVLAAVAFAAWIALVQGRQSALEFVAGYTIETSLSIDNLFVFMVLFQGFRISPRRQHKALLWGVAGAVVLRGLFILAGVTLLKRFDWVTWIFGLFLLYAAFRLVRGGSMLPVGITPYYASLLSRSDPELARVIETQGVKAYSLQMQDTLEPFLPARIVKGAVMEEWRALLFRHPTLYLQDRLALFWQVLATPDIALCHPAYAGIDGEPDQLRALGLITRIRPQDIKLAAYARGFMGTPVLSHLAFAGLGLVLLVFYLARRRPADIAMAGLILGAFAFAATFLFVSVACDYRYLYPTDLAVMLALFQFFASPARR